MQDVLPPDELAALLASPHRPNYCLGVRAGFTHIFPCDMISRHCTYCLRAACLLVEPGRYWRASCRLKPRLQAAELLVAILSWTIAVGFGWELGCLLRYRST